jgi:streptomycin 6-kinase
MKEEIIGQRDNILIRRAIEERVEERIRDWGVVVHDTQETQSSFIAFGKRGNQPVVLKILRQPGDEWRSGEVLDAFDGKGVAQVYEYVEGAVLLERLSPGTSLADIALAGRDDEATEILAEVIQRMSNPRESSSAFVTAQDWGKGFDRYLASGDHQIPNGLVERGQRLYLELCASQRDVRLLHGDLQHYNILFDSDRGWLAIDPKGVVGEVEYEIGPSLRNPYENPDLFISPKRIERRLMRFEAELKLDANRMLAWGFAQAVLSAIWEVEDGFTVDARNPSIMLANAIRLILE